MLAMISAYLAVFRDWSPYLSPGEIPTVMVIAADRKQSRVIFRYTREFIKALDVVSIERETTPSRRRYRGSAQARRGHGRGEASTARPCAHLQRHVTRHGRAVWYVRIGRGARVRIRASFGSPEFDTEYLGALQHCRPVNRRGRIAPRRSAAWLG